jgi:hypothetical protein
VCAGVADGFARGLSFMAAEVVEDDDVALVQSWDEHISNIDTEEIAVDRSIDAPWGVNAVMAQRCNKGHGLPMTVRHKCLDPLAFRSPAAQRAMLVFTQVSSRNTTRFGSILAW